MTQTIPMKMYLKLFIAFSIASMPSAVSAQNESKPCKVVTPNLVGNYTGGCKNGLADGKGEATGVHRFDGTFKQGLPHGKGTYYYNDGNFHTGGFYVGMREGKGEEHFKREGLPDSIVSGYWSGDVYRGKKYKTYDFSSSRTWDINDVIATEGSGRDVTFEISTTTGSPSGAPMTMSGGSGYVLTLRELIATDGSFIRKSSNFSTGNKSSSTYLITTFPVKLFATLSDGQTIQLELYKPASWMVRLYLNK